MFQKISYIKFTEWVYCDFMKTDMAWHPKPIFLLYSWIFFRVTLRCLALLLLQSCETPVFCSQVLLLEPLPQVLYSQGWFCHRWPAIVIWLYTWWKPNLILATNLNINSLGLYINGTNTCQHNFNVTFLERNDCSICLKVKKTTLTRIKHTWLILGKGCRVKGLFSIENKDGKEYGLGKGVALNKTLCRHGEPSNV